MLKKSFAMVAVFGLLVFGASVFHSQAEAADIWIYTSADGTEYYLRDYYLPARSWSFAAVVKVERNNQVTNLAYRFDPFDGVHYSVYYGTKAYDIISRDAKRIEEGRIADNPPAAIIWNNYLAPMEAERWARIRANESGRR